MKIGIIGTGVFSTAVAYNLAQNAKNSIVLWSEDKKIVEDFQKTNKFEKLFKDKEFPKNVTATTSYEETLKNADFVLLMTSIAYLESVCNDIKDVIAKDVPICIGTKGIIGEKPKMVHQIVKGILKNPIGVLGGPTFAVDVCNLAPIAFNVATKSKKVRSAINNAFQLDNVKVVFTRDLTSVALLGSIKNVYALGAGMISGMGYKESTLAYYLTVIYNEAAKVIYKCDGEDVETLHSLAGFGDIVATCTSSESRNYQFGELFGKKKSKKDIDTFKEKNTLEGVETLKNIKVLVERKRIKAPILLALYAIIFEDAKVETLLEAMKEVKLKIFF